MNLHSALGDSGCHWAAAALPFVLATALAACVAPHGREQAPPAAAPVTPDLAYPELFDAVQRRPLFADQKTFADARPLRDPARIRADYLAQRDAPGFDLQTFVAR